MSQSTNIRLGGDRTDVTVTPPVSTERERLEAQRGPRPSMPEWCTRETADIAHAFMDYVLDVEAKASKRQWAKVMKFLDGGQELFSPIEKKLEREVAVATIQGGEEGAAVAAANAFMVSTIRVMEISIAILTGVKPSKEA